MLKKTKCCSLNKYGFFPEVPYLENSDFADVLYTIVSSQQHLEKFITERLQNESLSGNEITIRRQNFTIVR